MYLYTTMIKSIEHELNQLQKKNHIDGNNKTSMAYPVLQPASTIFF